MMLVAGLIVLPILLWQVVKLANNKTISYQTPQLVSPAPMPVYTNSLPIDQSFPSASASAMYIMDRQSGSILYERHSQDQRYPASTAKLMTAVVARKLYSLNQVIQIREEAFAQGSSAHFVLGEQITFQNLLYALFLPSGNDAALVLANHHPRGYQGFVAEMNKTATALHLNNSHFGNPSGLDVDQQMSTARDLAILANEVMKDAVLRQIVGTKQTTITDVSGKLKHYLVNTNELLGVVPGVVGIKTGTTDSAGENLVTEVDRDGHQIIIVLLGSQNRYNEASAIIQWVFANYQWRSIVSN